MLSHDWLSDLQLREELGTHIMGEASRDNLRESHDELAALHRLRLRLFADLARLTETVQASSETYARKAHALYGHCDSLASGADTPELASSYRQLRDFLFPQGLSLLKRSYTEQVGAVVELEKCMTPEIMRQLRNIQVGPQTLADVYHAWLEAGRIMGECVKERIQIQLSLSREGSAAEQANSSVVRFKWIRAAHMLIGVVKGLPLSDEVRERFFGLLQKTLAEAARRRQESPADDEVGGDDSNADTEPAELAGETTAQAPAEPTADTATAAAPAVTPAAEPVAEVAASPAEPAAAPAAPQAAPAVSPAAEPAAAPTVEAMAASVARPAAPQPGSHT